MNCSKCGAEQPESAKFCSQCAAPLTLAKNAPAESKRPNWLAVVLVLGLVFIALVAWRLAQDNDRLRMAQRAARPPIATQMQPQPHALNLTNGAATINATSYSWYTFVVPVGATNAVVNGHFSATGGSGNDIDCFILDEDGFVNFKNGHPANTYFNSGKTTQAKIATGNLSAGTYYLILDNRFSLLTPKAVQVQAVLTYYQ